MSPLNAYAGKPSSEKRYEMDCIFPDDGSWAEVGKRLQEEFQEGATCREPLACPEDKMVVCCRVGPGLSLLEVCSSRA